MLGLILVVYSMAQTDDFIMGSINSAKNDYVENIEIFPLTNTFP